MDSPNRIARYELTSELGRGGMGVVYRAEDPQLGRAVAIKVILFPAHSTDEFRAHLERRFEREARAAAGIQHPGVVTVHDFGRDGDYLYLVMELIDGDSLSDRLNRGWKPDRGEALEIVARVADGLAAAHTAGVVHRDVTPRNILLAKDGRVVVTDFGIARSLGEETIELTSTGMLVGSPSFMAPEQVRNLDFDHRADLFSLGVVLFRLVADRLPFSATDLTSLLYQIAHENPLQDNEVRGKLGSSTCRFLERCLAKEPDERVPTAVEFAAEARRLRAESEASEIEKTVALGALASDREGARAGGFATRSLWAAVLAVVAIGAIWWIAGLTGDGPGVPASSAPVSRVADAPSPREAPEVEAIAASADTTRAPDLEATESDPSPVGALAEDRSAPAEPAGFEGNSLRAATEASERLPVPSLAEADKNHAAPASLPAVAKTPTQREQQDPATALADLSALEDAVDTVPPVLAIDPYPMEMTSAQVVLTGRVMDDYGGIELTLDGDRVVVEEDGAFVTDRDLSPGRNELIFVAADAAGNRTMKSVEVTVSSGQPPAGTMVAGTPPAGAAAGGPVAATFRTEDGPRPGGPQPVVQPRFADRGDGTLIDTRAKLTWSKRPSDTVLAWKASKAYCRKLYLGRKDDWMLPTIEELEELYRAAGQGSTGRLRFPVSTVWSGSKKGLGKAWTFDFSSGERVELAFSGGDQPAALKTLCVRREPDPRQRRPQGFDPPDLGGGFDPPSSRGGLGGPPPPGGGGGGQPGNAQGNSRDGGGGGSGGKKGGKGGSKGGGN